MTGASEARVTQAHRWMGQLPRDQFDLLLILTNEAADRGAREATAPLLAALEEAERLLRRYRHETPVGHQPHMICHEADETLATITAALAKHKGAGDEA
jgi:hypothetical protein